MPSLCARAIRNCVLAVLFLCGVGVYSDDSFLAWSLRDERLSLKDFEKYLPAGARVRLDAQGFSILEQSKPWSDWDLKRISYAPGVKGLARSAPMTWDFGPALPLEPEVRQEVLSFEQKRWERFFSDRSLASESRDQRRVLVLPQAAKEAWNKVLSLDELAPFQWRDPPKAQASRGFSPNFVGTTPDWVKRLTSRKLLGALVAFGTPDEADAERKFSESAWVYASLWRACKEVPAPSSEMRRILLPVHRLDRHSEVVLRELVRSRCRMEQLTQPDSGRSAASL